MNWKNAAKDALPNDGEEVLISVNGVNYVATFSSNEQAFHVRQSDIKLNIKENLIYWASIARLKK